MLMLLSFSAAHSIGSDEGLGVYVRGGGRAVIRKTAQDLQCKEMRP